MLGKKISSSNALLILLLFCLVTTSSSTLSKSDKERTKKEPNEIKPVQKNDLNVDDKVDESEALKVIL